MDGSGMGHLGQRNILIFRNDRANVV